jgi:Cof subfamily protein (haloacid dehalogenase superfamily)
MHDVHAQLVVFDIDGTLVDSENPMSDVTAGALRELQKRGLQIAFASSRPIASLALLARHVGVDAHLIAYNGALARCASGQQLIAESFVMDMRLINVLRKFSTAGGAVNVYVYERLHWLAFGPSAFIDLEERATGLTADSRFPPEALLNVAGSSVLKVMCRSSRLACKQLLRDMDAYFDPVAVASASDCCDIQAKGVGKAHAIRELCHNLDIAPNDVVAFGDSDSDASMLRMAGYGVAVGAASARAKMAAREHIDGPGSDAIAGWLDRIAASD